MQDRKVTELKIGFINVHGLLNKLKFRELDDYVLGHDIIGMAETFISDYDGLDMLNDTTTIPGYSLIHKPRKKTSSRNSGGLCFAVKQELRPLVKEVESGSDHILWCKIDNSILDKREDLYLGCVYISPEGSRYSSRECFFELEADLINVTCLSSNVIVCGDFNAYTNTCQDYISYDDEDLLASYIDNVCNVTEHTLISNMLPITRISQDCHPINTWGKLFLDSLRNANMLICNGRFGPSSTLYTTSNETVIDYFICSPEIINSVKYMHVCDFNPILSDVHAPLVLVINSKIEPDTQAHIRPTKDTENAAKVGNWDSNKVESFVGNLNLETIAEINRSIEQLNHAPDKQCEINKIMHEVSTVFLDSGFETFGEKPKYKKNKRKALAESKPWYNITCRNKRVIFNRSRKKYQITKCKGDLNCVKEAGKQYKQEILKAHRTHSDNIRAKVREIRKQKNKKAFWDYCKSKNKNVAHENLDFEQFTNFFKNLNSYDNPSNDDNPNPEQPTTRDNARLDMDINETEIRSAVAKLKLNKACGQDRIANEYIKASIDIMLPTYLLLFNHVYTHGTVPESWTIGTIKPIYKNKGSVKDPDNYRPITILSCMGKLFTAVLNNRLTAYINDETIVGEEQLGFRAGYSTIDGVFALHSIHAILKQRKKQLFCAFIDLKKCFGSIWREGLWLKLRNLNLGVKMTNTIYSIYQNIKSCLLLHSKGDDGALVCNMSEPFACENGLREGENLSPLLFSLYVNDLSNFLQDANCKGTSIPTNTDDGLLVYFKLLLLMYADDTVLFASNKRELQKSLDAYARYCTNWKLDINVSKTKIVCFGRKRNSKFNISNEEIEIVDNFKYLGVNLSKNGRFLNAIKQNITKATKGLHSLRASFREKHIPLDCQLEICQKTIEPILLYGAEVWGFENLAPLETFQLKYLKHMLGVRPSTPTYMTLGEAGKVPISVKIKQQMIMFWKRLMTGSHDKISFILYQIMLKDTIENNAHYKWLAAIEGILTETGNRNVWLGQTMSQQQSVSLKQTLHDQAVQAIYSACRLSNKGRAYASIKPMIRLEPFVAMLGCPKTRAIIQFRTANHKFPIETGRYNNTPLAERNCPYCINKLGDEFHYLLECERFQAERKKYISKKYYIRPNMLNFLNIIHSDDKIELDKVSTFITILMKAFK